MRIGLGINQETNDLHVDDAGNLVMVRDDLAVAQHVRQRLKTFQKEWFLDTSAGVIWLDEILGRAYDPAIAESVVKAEIMATDGVTEITSFNVTFDRVTRGLMINRVEVRTVYDSEARI